MDYAVWLLAGTLFGFLIGIIPVAGATIGLITLFGFIDYFRADPYILVVFTTAIVVASTIGDSFASVVLNIPGAGGSAATMVDGFPMSQRGEAARALSAAVVTSCVNGAIWGTLVFAFLPWYSQFILNFGISEMLMFLMLAFVSVCFVNSTYWFRGIIALCLGIFVGLIGQDPIDGGARYTGGWDYLRDGVQMVPIMAGILAFPELWAAFRKSTIISKINTSQTWKQIAQGAKDSWRYKWDGVRGGLVGAFIGAVPGIGGSVADWLAYGQTVASNPNEEFGKGNVRGVIGAEGANNAQKATSYLPTILFGVPGAPFEVIILGLFMMVGLELGTPELLADHKFFDSIYSSYAGSLVLTFIISILFIRYAIKFVNVPFKYYFWPVMAILLWTSVQYTGYWEDYAMFAICCVVGLVMKRLKLSRAAFIIGFALSAQLERTFVQYVSLYDWSYFVTQPLSLTLFILTIIIGFYGIFINRAKGSYA